MRNKRDEIIRENHLAKILKVTKQERIDFMKSLGKWSELDEYDVQLIKYFSRVTVHSSLTIRRVYQDICNKDLRLFKLAVNLHLVLSTDLSYCANLLCKAEKEGI